MSSSCRNGESENHPTSLLLEEFSRAYSVPSTALYFRFMVGQVGIFKAIFRGTKWLLVAESLWGRSRPVKSDNPDFDFAHLDYWDHDNGKWLHDLKCLDMPGIESYWTEEGLLKYFETGLFRKQQSLIQGSIFVRITWDIRNAVYRDDFQVGVPSGSGLPSVSVGISEFLSVLDPSVHGNLWGNVKTPEAVLGNNEN